MSESGPSPMHPHLHPQLHPHQPLQQRRRALLAGAAVAADALAAKLGLAAAALAPLAACSSAPVPPTVWLRLASDLPPAGGAAPAPAALPSAPREVWQLVLPVPMPAHLDRDGLYLPQGAAGALVRPLDGARWIEPLRDAVPRLLREDLARRSGAPVWTAPLPPGLAPTRQLRVEITAFEIAADGQALVTQARWSLAETRGTRPPVAHEARFTTAPGAAGAAESWALAHRQAIATLADRIAVTLASL